MVANVTRTSLGEAGLVLVALFSKTRLLSVGVYCEGSSFPLLKGESGMIFIVSRFGWVGDLGHRHHSIAKANQPKLVA